MPKVSVLIPSYNAAHFLSISIESAIAQTYQDFEIIIIDDGSTDNTKELVKSYIKKYANKIHYIYQENKGLAIARNTGIENSQGEYIALLDADDKWFPCRLEEGVNVLNSESSIGLVHGKVIPIDVNNNIIEAGQPNPKFLSGYIFTEIFLRKADIACPTVLFRRRCCQDVGNFDVNLSRLGCEDRDLWLRISKKYKIKYINKVLSNYLVAPKSMSKNLERMLEARLYIVNKYCPQNEPNKRNLRNRALSKIFRDRGDQFLFLKDYINARQEYQKAISYYPLAFWPWINLIKAFLYDRKKI